MFIPISIYSDIYAHVCTTCRYTCVYPCLNGCLYTCSCTEFTPGFVPAPFVPAIEPVRTRAHMRTRVHMHVCRSSRRRRRRAEAVHRTRTRCAQSGLGSARHICTHARTHARTRVRVHVCTHARTCTHASIAQCFGEAGVYARENCPTSCGENCGDAGGSVPVPVVTPPAVPVPVVLPAPAIVPAPVQPCADLPDEAVAQQVTATGSRLSGCGEASEQGLCSAPIVAQGCPVSCGTCATPPIFVAPPSTEPIPNPPPAPSPAGGSAPVCTNYCQIGDGLLCKSFGWGEGSIDMRIVMCIDMYRHVCRQHRHCQHL